LYGPSFAWELSTLGPFGNNCISRAKEDNYDIPLDAEGKNMLTN
jgi:hypothetical protein